MVCLDFSFSFRLPTPNGAEKPLIAPTDEDSHFDLSFFFIL